MALSQERMGQIALLVVKKLAREKSMNLDPSRLRREVGSFTKEMNIRSDEAAGFIQAILSEAFTEVLEELKELKK
ncbi:MAG: hypothetical protein AAB628_02480 [Patescibacteria group bacterium]